MKPNGRHSYPAPVVVADAAVAVAVVVGGVASMPPLLPRETTLLPLSYAAWVTLLDATRCSRPVLWYSPGTIPGRSVVVNVPSCALAADSTALRCARMAAIEIDVSSGVELAAAALALSAFAETPLLREQTS